MDVAVPRAPLGPARQSHLAGVSGQLEPAPPCKPRAAPRFVSFWPWSGRIADKTLVNGLNESTSHLESRRVLLASPDKAKGNGEQKEPTQAVGLASGAGALQLQSGRGCRPRWALPPRRSGSRAGAPGVRSPTEATGSGGGRGCIVLGEAGKRKGNVLPAFPPSGVGKWVLCSHSSLPFLLRVVWRGSARVSFYKKWSPGSGKLCDPGVARPR